MKAPVKQKSGPKPSTAAEMGSQMSVACTDITCLTKVDPAEHPSCTTTYCVDNCQSSYETCSTRLEEMSLVCACEYKPWFYAMIVLMTGGACLLCCCWALVAYDVRNKKRERLLTMNILTNPLRPVPAGNALAFPGWVRCPASAAARCTPPHNPPAASVLQLAGILAALGGGAASGAGHGTCLRHVRRRQTARDRPRRC